MRSFEARRLDAPGLKRFLEAQLRRKSDEWPPKEWDPMLLTLAAFYFNPDLEVARRQLEVAEAGVITARQRPNPTIRIAPGYAMYPESPWLFDFVPLIPIETAGKRGYRIAVAERTAETARFQLGETAWQLRMQVRSALVNRFATLDELILLHEEQRLRESASNLLNARLVRGELARPPVNAAGAQVDNVKVAIRSAEGRLYASQTALASAIGVPLDALTRVPIVWPTFARPATSPPPASVQRAAILNRMDVRRLLVEYAVAESALQLEVTRQYPDIQLGPGYQLDEGVNKFSLGLTAVLPIFNQNQGPIAQAEARRKEAAARFTALQARAIVEAAGALAQYRAAVARLRDAGALVGVWSRQAQLERVSLQKGESDRLSLINVLLQGATAATTRLSALENAQTAMGALENAIQRPLDPAWDLPNAPVSAAVEQKP